MCIRDRAGPFSPERAGSLPVGDVVTLAFSGKYTLPQLRKLFNGQSGLVGYLGSNDARSAVARAERGDAQAAMVLEAMAYQIAKEIGAMATAVSYTHLDVYKRQTGGSDYPCFRQQTRLRIRSLC